jgi:dephospho-CoA kinase
MIIGLTGGMGSGKSTVAQYFRDCGVSIIQTDEIARQLLAPNQPILEQVISHFGQKILDKNGALNRIALRNMVFESEPDRRWLEALLHPLIKTEILKHAKAPYTVVEIPLLIEAHFEDIVDRILVIDCPIALQIERIQKRDQMPVELIQKIINTQLDRQSRLEKADDIIDNSSDLDTLKKQVLMLHEHYTELSK